MVDNARLIKIGSRSIAQSFMLLSVVVKDDVRQISNMSTAWPSILNDLSEMDEDGYAVEWWKRQSSPSRRLQTQNYAKEISRSFKLTELYAALPFHMDDKKVVLHKCLTGATWKKTAARYGYHWSSVRQLHDQICLYYTHAAKDILLN